MEYAALPPTDPFMEYPIPIPYYQTFSLLLIQGLPLYSDMVWRIMTESTPDGAFLEVAIMVFYVIFCFHHPSYSSDVIRMGQTALYLMEWATATYCIQYWYASERFNVGYIVGYSIFSFLSMTIALATHHGIQQRTPLPPKTISQHMAPMPEGNIQQIAAQLRPFYEPGNSVQPYQHIV